MKLLFENWKKFINEGDAAFHGFKMKPTQMRVSPQCDTPPNDNQWETGEPGCPQFTDDRGIDSSHEDIVEAIEFLDNVRPDNLIAYSRGGAVALAALARSKHSPRVTFVAPAWRRGWVNGIENPTYSNGVIIHGTADEFVPLWHSADLSLKTGMPLYVFEGMKHVNILKYKGAPESGRELTQEEKQKLVDASASVAEQTEPYQRKVKAKHKRMKIRLIGKGKGKHTAGSYKEKPSYDRSKSAPPGG